MAKTTLVLSDQSDEPRSREELIGLFHTRGHPWGAYFDVKKTGLQRNWVLEVHDIMVSDSVRKAREIASENGLDVLSMTQQS